MGHYNKRMSGESSSISRIILPDDHFAYLDYIKIQDIYQGKGFGSEALLRFNQFLDDMGISYTVLYVESDTKYAANTYRKKGFNFITDTFDIIRKRMGEEAYLKDSSSKLLDENEKEINPMMIRWRQGDETRALRLRKYVMNLSSADFEKKFEEYLDYLKSQSLDMKKILEKTNNEGKTAWNEAINANNLKAIVRLIEIVDQRIISQKGEEGNTALHLAVEWENYELVEILLNTMNQEAINQQSNDGLTALHLALIRKICG